MDWRCFVGLICCGGPLAMTGLTVLVRAAEINVDRRQAVIIRRENLIDEDGLSVNVAGRVAKREINLGTIDVEKLIRNSVESESI